VVVSAGAIVGAGYHHRAGLPHAEVNALAAAGEQARGATLYVTLEPCSTSGRTPPCTQAIIRAGIRRVVIGCLDPNPKHAGQGVEILRQQGIEVISGVEERACLRLNEAFFHWIRTKRPLVMLKMAMTLDGKIAAQSGQSKWITGGQARSRVQKMRQWADAIMVGGETVRLDNPGLTVRTPQGWPRQPQKLVWTRHTAADFDPDLAIFADPERPPRFVAPATPEQWQTLLEQLGAEDMTALLIEGGGELAAAALRAGIVDKLAFFIAPKILGGRGSRPVVGGENPLSLGEALPLKHITYEQVGKDLQITGYLNDVYGID
jgi:diaminohydroxyphosphoribosylaminopyrimidine deaminase/5-amino-6-(5-phosphoribosylamino)uracil reductase